MPGRLPPSRLNLLLVRHAQSQNNVAHAQSVEDCDGDLVRAKDLYETRRAADPELSALGRRQAAIVGEALGPLAARPDTLLVASPMRRALDTAQAIAEVGQVPRERFRCQGDLYEVGGAYVGERAAATANADALEAAHPVHCRDISEAGWYSGRGVESRGAEPVEHCWARLDRVMAWTQALGAEAMERGWSRAIVVVHGDLMSRWLRRLFEVPWYQRSAFVHGNTGITRVQLALGDPGGGALLQAHNELEHLPAALRSGLGPVWWHYSWPDVEVSLHDTLEAVPEAWRGALEALWSARGFGPDVESLDALGPIAARSVWCVARVRGEVVGGALHDPQAGWAGAGGAGDLGRLRAVVVAPSHAGRGLGEGIVEALARARRGAGDPELRVHAPSKSGEFYARCGFTRVDGQAPEGGGTEPWLPMRLEL
ncbi:putative phosphoglycerate mutase/fructose-2,6-bisphosphatase [Plesiocystis pacifica SIR-1]|uniref:Putative phosphoglycerate mutase/fructose-2,6-bisphosphatase n=1 Tax=Plesiocystis pacifica SIR-1 TaxID=391625 RepID=A6GCR4_9BACT|nr:GNAT family N-acetyltransferase [Plesiocystis pacifica]EDM76330.1 putative phosphoglycerate mutase/fructose-2,6-bisphosphatase [Plesiocystis pacifica SIR-1]